MDEPAETLSRRKRFYQRWWFWLVVAIVVIGGIAGTGNGDNGQQASSSKSIEQSAAPPETGTATAPPETGTATAPPETQPAKPTAGIGTEVRDGKFAFTVTKTGRAVLVGDQYLNKKAQGEFIIVHVTVKNIGKEPQTLFAANQELYIGAAKYSADDEAGIYLNKSDSSTFINEINPGNSMTGTLVFDVPKGAKPTKIVLHDSAFSGGVNVQL